MKRMKLCVSVLDAHQCSMCVLACGRAHIPVCVWVCEWVCVCVCVNTYSMHMLRFHKSPDSRKHSIFTICDTTRYQRHPKSNLTVHYQFFIVSCPWWEKNNAYTIYYKTFHCPFLMDAVRLNYCLLPYSVRAKMMTKAQKVLRVKIPTCLNISAR